VIRLARTPQSVLATLLALLAVGVRLLLPALHTHAAAPAGAAGEAPVAAAVPSLFGGCPCDPWTTTAYELDERDVEPPRHEAAPLLQAHACLACDFELAQPAALPPPSALPAIGALPPRASPVVARARPTAQAWARPPTRAPPRATARA
jgi:hypothetical protein